MFPRLLLVGGPFAAPPPDTTSKILNITFITVSGRSESSEGAMNLMTLLQQRNLLGRKDIRIFEGEVPFTYHLQKR